MFLNVRKNFLRCALGKVDFCFALFRWFAFHTIRLILGSLFGVALHQNGFTNATRCFCC